MFVLVSGQSIWNIILTILLTAVGVLQQLGHSKTQTNISDLKNTIAKSGKAGTASGS